MRQGVRLNVGYRKCAANHSLYKRSFVMAGRPPKKGIDYAGWSTGIFDNDTKIDKLLDAHGTDGFFIYFYLCNRAYGGEGYFYKWSYDDCASTARKMCIGIGSGTVREAVGYCLQIGLFDKRLFEEWGVLTSRGIQKRYCIAIKDRDVKEVVAEYWLLQEHEECKGLIKLPLNSDSHRQNTNSPAENAVNPEGKTNFPSQKESKVNKNNIPCAPEPHDTAPDKDAELENNFEIIYAIYPKKRGRTGAFASYKAWVGKGKNIGGKWYRLTNRQIYLAVKKYIRQQEEAGQDDLTYWKNFDTLMGRQLLDYVDLGGDKK